VFLDRDGTINVEKEYLHRIEDFEFLPVVPKAIRRLNNAGYSVIVVTNQSGIARGYYGEEDVERLHRHLQSELAGYGAVIDAFYFCPHHPEQGIGDYKIECGCRKGAPGMLLQAAFDHELDLGSSWMVGDTLVDIEAGLLAGCRSILVLTGHGRLEKGKLGALRERTLVASDLMAAVDLILDNGEGTQGPLHGGASSD
jgi:D-glycero-D-manno-heptose 1,7-bisphosphate phosphatase